ncbi:MAG: hypothetical protein GXY83_42465 [Rhodopirellula sp.]|nr:hypothetical protein [Rhodopirellula sp.]
MSNHNVKVHEVEYLACGAGTTGEHRIIVITVRPDEGSFRPHNLGIDRSQAKRLLEDLQSLLSPISQPVINGLALQSTALQAVPTGNVPAKSLHYLARVDHQRLSLRH